MEVPTILAFKIFVSATVSAGLLNMHVVQQLKQFSIRFHSGEFIDQNLRWVNSLPTVRRLIGRSTISYMKSRTLFFPIFELIFGALVTLSLYRLGLGTNFLRTAIFLVIAIPLSMISWQDDPDSSVAPNVITYPGTVVGVVLGIILGPADIALPHAGVEALMKLSPTVANTFLSIITAFLGILMGGGSLWLMGWIWERLRGVQGMGMGAVKTGMMIGAFLGWRLALLMIFVAVLTGSVCGIVLVLRKGNRGSEMFLPMPTFLVLGGIVALLWGNTLLLWYLAQFNKTT